MREPRLRNDTEDTLYKISNCLIGKPGDLEFDQQASRQLQRIANRLSKLYVIKLTLLEIFRRGYVMLVAAPAAWPSRETVENRFHAYYGPLAEVPDFADPAVLRHWAERLRDISQFIKDLEQAFTNWLNRVKHSGTRCGTSWSGRFKSAILGSARHIFAAMTSNFWDGKPPFGRARSGADWEKSLRWQWFQERHPALAEALEFSGRISGALCVALATHTLYPLRQAIHT
ncbi:MAG: hypothetical protein WC708_06675 [Lentisphaeria bacterium]